MGAWVTRLCGSAFMAATLHANAMATEAIDTLGAVFQTHNTSDEPDIGAEQLHECFVIHGDKLLVHIYSTDHGFFDDQEIYVISNVITGENTVKRFHDYEDKALQTKNACLASIDTQLTAAGYGIEAIDEVQNTVEVVFKDDRVSYFQPLIKSCTEVSAKTIRRNNLP